MVEDCFVVYQWVSNSAVCDDLFTCCPAGQELGNTSFVEYSESIPTSVGGGLIIKQILGSYMRIIARVVVVFAAILGISGSGSSAPLPQDRIRGEVDAAQVSRLRGTTHPRALAQLDLGRTDPMRMISGAITFRLSPAQQADMDQLLRDQQDPKSPRYHRWITPDQYAARFGMTSSDLAKVNSWLKSQGLTIDSISRNRNEISFSGSVGQVEYAFRTELHNFNVRGVQHFANATDISFPTAFSNQVLGVRGLDNFVPKPRVRPLPKLTSNLTGNHFLIPGDFAVIYNLPAAFTGAGQSIAVVGQTTISTGDLDTFRTNSGLPLTSASNFQQTTATGTGTAMQCSGDETEADLDLEWSEGVAKNAKIIYVIAGVGSGGTCASRTRNVFDALQYAITQNVAPVVSISYGNCEANLGRSFVLTMQQWAQQANSQGQTISGPSGDDGAADCESGNSTTASHGLAVDVPAAIPEVTGVGGTEFTGDSSQCPNSSCPGNVAPADQYWSASSSSTSGASALQYIPEKVWNDSDSSGLSATGGGASTVFSKPSWQTGAGVPADGKRDVPDISFNASNAHDPYLICGPQDCTNGFRDASNNFSGVGGTSAGAPVFAGVLALLNQATSSNGLGNVNPMLYSLAANSASNHAFHDVTSGDNKVTCTAGTSGCPTGTTSIGFSAATGYDLTTGLGSLNIANLVTAWVASAPAADFDLNGLTTTATRGSSGNSTITVTALNGFTGTVNLTCSPSSQNVQISCSLNPAILDMSSGTTNNTKTSTLNITTVADLETPFRWKHTGTFFATTGGLFAAVLLGGISSRPRRWLQMIAMFAVLLTLAGVACGGGGGGGSSKVTPAGTYSISVTGTSGSTSHATDVSLVVQ
jgi:subtilase family serine protease